MPHPTAAQVPLGDMPMEELEALEGLLAREMKRRREAEREDAIRKLREEAKKMGYSLDELLPRIKPEKPRRGVLPPRYRSLEDPSLTWSGRGPRPAWFAAHLDAGGRAEDMLIDPDDNEPPE